MFQYDVFISHSSQDTERLTDLAAMLKRDGLRVWFEKASIVPGDLIPAAIAAALRNSRTLLLCMSSSAFDSPWVELERQTIVFTDPTNARRRLVPLRLDDAELPDTLRAFAYVDWRDPAAHDLEYARLLEALRPPESLEAPATPTGRSFVGSFPGHGAGIRQVAFHRGNEIILAASLDGTIAFWNAATRTKLHSLDLRNGGVLAMTASPDGRTALCGGMDGTLQIVSLSDPPVCVGVMGEETSPLFAVACAPDGLTAVTGSAEGHLMIWNLEKRCVERELARHSSALLTVATDAEGRQALAGYEDGSLRLFDLRSGVSQASFTGHTGAVNRALFLPIVNRAVSVSSDATVRVWDLRTMRCLSILEGHTNPIYGLAVFPDPRHAVTASLDQTVRVWNLDAGSCLINFRGPDAGILSVALSSEATTVVGGTIYGHTYTWTLPRPLAATPASGALDRYTNAKVLLVGASGVGKSGLALRLTRDLFEPTVSSDGVWASQLQIPGGTGPDQSEREVWLWDFAGQSDYRLIQQLFLDETALAVLIFDPQCDDPFEGLLTWDRDISRAARRPLVKLLVAGRCDRGGLTVSRRAVEQFCESKVFAQYLETSAATGAGCSDLRELIVAKIPWSDLPWTASPRMFKVLKDEILRLRDEGKMLLRMSELKQQLEVRLAPEVFSHQELEAVVGLLAGPGLLWRLEFGDFVLLRPEIINSYAGAVIRSVRGHSDEIGCIAEQDVLSGRLDYGSTARLAAGDEQIVLRAMQQTFVEHGLCLREPTDTGTVLVFPSYFRRERPEQAGHPALLVSYDLSGALDEIYATLVVRLHHTTAFRRRQLWRFAADFETQANKLIGFSLHKAAEGRGEFAIYSDASVSEEEKALFIRYIHEHLTSRADHCTRRRHYACYSCGSQVIDRRAVERRLARGEKDIVCSDCEGRVQLWDLIEEKFGSNELAKQVVALERTARKGIDWDGQRLKMAAEVYSVAREAGLMFRQYPRPESGIHGEIEMPELAGRPWKARLFVVIVGQDNLEAREGWLRYGKDWERRGYVRMVYDVSGMMYWTDVGIGRSEVPAGVIAGPEELGGAPMTTLSLLAIRDKLSRRRPHTPETDSGKPGPIRLPHHSLLPEDQSLRHKRLDGENEAGIASAAALPKGAGATVTNRIRVIFLAADPTDAARLRLGAEVRHIQEKLQLARLRDRITLDQRMAVRTQDLSQSLLDTTPQIVHFSGHGTVDGALCFESEDGSAHPVPPEALASLFREFTDCVQCVVLNACYSDEQARAIAAHIPFVIGMSAAISDSAAIAFAIGFYQGLGAGRSIPQAFQLGVAQIRLQGVPEHLTPILASRGSRDPNGAEEGTPGA